MVAVDGSAGFGRLIVMAKEGSGCFTKIFAAGLCVVAVVVIARLFGGSGSAGSGQSSAPLETVAAEAMARDYAENEVAADSKYKGRRFTLTGTVSRVHSAIIGETVSLNGFGFRHVDACALSKEAAATLKTDQPVAFTCVGTGTTIGTPSADCGN